jgi:hypothetical protein
MEIQPVVVEVVSHAAHWPGVAARYSPATPPLMKAPAPVVTEMLELSPVISQTGCVAATRI